MLFDLRSRGRRTTVRVIYLFLALVMVSGLVLVGVGTGSNQGGLLNAFTNNGSGGGASSVYEQQVQKAVKGIKKTPDSAAAWSSLAQARWGAASSGSNFDATGTYTKTGKQQLVLAASAWNHYLKLKNNKPSPELAQLAAGIYQNLAQYKNEADAWNFAVSSQPTGSVSALKPLLCLALSSYAAGGHTAKGDLAAAAALKLTPKLQKLTLQSSLKAAKASPTTAKETLVEEC